MSFSIYFTLMAAVGLYKSGYPIGDTVQRQRAAAHYLAVQTVLSRPSSPSNRGAIEGNCLFVSCAKKPVGVLAVAAAE